MVQRVSTVAFEGIEARAVDVQVQVAPGLPRPAGIIFSCDHHNDNHHAFLPPQYLTIRRRAA